jgi:radical SAM superfamily enzyme
LITSFEFWIIKNQKFFQTLLLKKLEFGKINVQFGPKYSQNVKKIALHQGFDHFNSSKVPHNGCKGETKNTKPK